MSTKHGRVVQGLFVGGRPTALRQARMAQARTAPSPVRSQGQPPTPGAARTSHVPVVQRHAHDVAFQLPHSLSNFGSSHGQPLPTAVREKMESAFGASFDDVRIHVGPQASSIGALAFTLGTDLYFAPGQYNPQTIYGQQLLGHELTHVVQQRGGRVRNPFGTGLAVVQDHAMEAEADRMGRLASQPQMAKLAQPKMAADAQPTDTRHKPPVYRPVR